jgi:hypothetical protein
MDRINLRELIDLIIDGSTPATDDRYPIRAEGLSFQGVDNHCGAHCLLSSKSNSCVKVVAAVDVVYFVSPDLSRSLSEMGGFRVFGCQW